MSFIKMLSPPKILILATYKCMHSFGNGCKKKLQLYVLYDLAYILRTNRPPHCATSSVMCFQRYFGNFLCVVFIHTILLRILGVLGYISILSIFFNSLALVLISGIFILMHQSCEGTGWLKRIW